MTRARSMLVVALVALGVVLVGTVADAQQKGRGGPPGGGFGGPGGGGGGPGGGGGGILGLLRNPQVQEELMLTEDQKTQLGELGRKIFSGMERPDPAARDADPEARRKQFEQQAAEFQKRAVEAQKEVASILLKQQYDRLIGILAQVEGLRALSNFEVADRVGLTGQQKAQIEAIEAASRQATMNLFSGMRDLSPEDRRAEFSKLREKSDALRAEVEQKTRAVLSAEQQQRLEQLKGEKFELRPMGPPGGRPGGPGGGPPGGPRG